MSDNSDDEIEIFTRKIKALKSVAGDLNSIIESQNNRIRGISPEIGTMLGRLKGIILQVGRSDSNRFKGWKYYLLATVLITAFIFIFFILF
jgi:hypothetical protein